jgi:hypothetical protein
MLRRLAEAQVEAPQVGAVAQERERILSFIASRKVYEVNEAYRNAGWLSDEPRYLEWCSARSGLNQYWIAEAVNTQGTCAHFRELSDSANAKMVVPAAPSPQASASRAVEISADPTEPDPLGSRDIREKGRELIRVVMTSLQAQARELLKGKTSRTPEVAVLVDGAPPLISEMLRRSREVIGKIAGVTFSEDERAAHQDLLEGAWRANRRSAIEVHLNVIRSYVTIAGRSVTTEQVSAMRDEIFLAASASGEDLESWFRKTMAGC